MCLGVHTSLNKITTTRNTANQTLIKANETILSGCTLFLFFATHYMCDINRLVNNLWPYVQFRMCAARFKFYSTSIKTEDTDIVTMG